MFKLAIVLFAKNPHLSPVKTRLEKQTSKEFALSFYQKSLNTTISLLQNLRVDKADTSFYIAVAEEEEMKHFYWRDYNLISQGSGGLGERLDNVYKEMINNNDAVFFFGADSPFMNESYLSSSISVFLNSNHIYFFQTPYLKLLYYLFL